MKLRAAVLVLLAAVAPVAASAEGWRTHPLFRPDVSDVGAAARYGRTGTPPLVLATNAVPTNVLAYTEARGLPLTEARRRAALDRLCAEPAAPTNGALQTAVFDYVVFPDRPVDAAERTGYAPTGTWDSAVTFLSPSICRSLVAASAVPAGRVIPVYLDHDPERRAGDVLRLYAEKGVGLIARVRLNVAPGVEPEEAYAHRAVSAGADCYEAATSDVFGSVAVEIPVRVFELSLVSDPRMPVETFPRVAVDADLLDALPTGRAAARARLK